MKRHTTNPYQQAAQADEDMRAEEAQARPGEGGWTPFVGDEADDLDAPAPEAAVEQVVEDPCKAQVDDVRMRAAAEMENFKKRLMREHAEQMRYAAERVLSDLLPTLDNLDLALQYGSQHEACRDMLQGVSMTRKLLLDAVTGHGLSPVGAEGEEFNPEVHEAVGFESRPEIAPGVVVRVLQSGYKLAGRLMRPAKVMINQ